jgi:hypothetical protein
VREAEVVNWTALLTNPTPNRQLRRTAFFPAFFSFSFFGAPKNGASTSPNAV